MWYKSHDSLQLWVIMAEMQSQPSFFMALLRITFLRTKLMGRQPFTLQSSLNYSLVWIFCLTVFRESVTGWLNLKTEFCPHVCWCKVFFFESIFSWFFICLQCVLKYHQVEWKIYSISDGFWQHWLQKYFISSKKNGFDCIWRKMWKSWNCACKTIYLLVKLYLNPEKYSTYF